MARYEIFANAPSFMAANTPGAIGPRLIYVNSTQFGIQNADGSRSYFTGTGIVWDAASDSFTAGTIAAIEHYTAGGAYIDSLRDINGGSHFIINDFLRLPAGTQPNYLFAEIDVLDARIRLNNAIVNDVLDGGFSNDTIYGGSGNDLLKGSEGSDELWGGTGNDVLRGDDSSSYSIAADTLDGEAGNDILFGNIGVDSFAGGAGIDTAVFNGNFASLSIVTTAAGTTVTQLNGDTETLTGIERIGADDGIYQFNASTGAWSKINGTAGLSVAFAGTTLTGTNGADTYTFSNYVEPTRVIQALGGNDTITVTTNGNTTTNGLLVRGGSGNDAITANGWLYGDAGNDTLNGTGILNGGAGNDNITSFLIDTIRPTEGDDFLTGGLGADLFNFSIATRTNGRDTWEYGWNDDVITDFQLGVDHITLAASLSNVDLTDTAEGLLLVYDLQGFRFGTGEPGVATILFKGLHGFITLDDLTL